MAAQTTYQQYPNTAFAGTWYDSSPGDATMGRNAEAAEIPFGVAVAYEGTNDQDAKLPQAGSDVIWGIAVHSHAHEIGPFGTIGDIGVKQTGSFNVALKGRMNVICENGCTPGQRLFVRHTAPGAEQLGALRSAVDGVNTTDMQTSGIWRSTTSAGGVAVLEFDFTNL